MVVSSFAASLAVNRRGLRTGGRRIQSASNRPSIIGANVLNADPESFRPPVRVIASRRRRRTVSARLRSGVLELLVPSWMSAPERDRWAEAMRVRLEKRMRRSMPSDERLDKRARELNRRHFGGRLRGASIGFAEVNS